MDETTVLRGDARVGFEVAFFFVGFGVEIFFLLALTVFLIVFAAFAAGAAFFVGFDFAVAFLDVDFFALGFFTTRSDFLLAFLVFVLASAFVDLSITLGALNFFALDFFVGRY